MRTRPRYRRAVMTALIVGPLAAIACGRGDASPHGTWYACAGVCVARGGGPPRCEDPNPTWRGPSCGTHPCPDGARCRVTVCELP